MTDFHRDDISQDQLHEFRNAAEAAWGEDTRHEKWQGHPSTSHGQCYVTSRWLKDKLGGHVGTKDDHYFWVSPDESHAIDLTGDNHAYPPVDTTMEGVPQDEDDPSGPKFGDHHRQWRPGPILYKHTSHPLFKGYHLVPDNSQHSRYDTFKSRADAALHNPNRKTAEFGWGGDAAPMDQPEAQEHLRHDEPESFAPQEYNYVFGRGRVEVSPHKDHTDLLRGLGISGADAGPVAVGTGRVMDGRAEFTTTGNVSANLLRRSLEDFCNQVGWEFGGITNESGNVVSKVDKVYWRFSNDEDHLYLGTSAASLANQTDPVGVAYVENGLVRVAGRWASHKRAVIALDEYAEDFNRRLAVGDNLIKRHEDLELENTYSPDGADYMQSPDDERPPLGNLKCPECGRLFGRWYEYVQHRQDEEPIGDEEPVEDGKFPEIDLDKPMPAHYHEREPQVFPLAKVAERMRHHAAMLWSNETDVDYAAFVNGRMVAMATINEWGEIIKLTAHKMRHVGAMLNKLKRDYDELTYSGEDPITRHRLRSAGFYDMDDGPYSKWSVGKQPKDMLGDTLPFVYDIENDSLVVGQPGGKHVHIKSPHGEFTPGGIVEGTYEPGGKVTVNTQTDWPWTTYHLLNLWYWNYPHMEVTGLEVANQNGETRKVATKTSQNVGQYIKQLAMADPAAWTAYKALTKAGGEVYVVGGAVRDALMQREPKDIDMMVRGLPSERVHNILREAPGSVDLTGKDFGVYRYRTKGAEVEIALPRTERSTGDRRVDFDVSVDHRLPIEEDLKRRDFTVNSMAVDLNDGRLVDPYDGAGDINDRRLRTVHPSSFVEDPTRIVRGLTAASKHGLLPDEGTRKQLVQHADKLDRESRERIQAELDKLFASYDPARGIRLAQETGVLSHIFPELSTHWDFDQRNPHHNHTLGDHSMHVLEGVQKASKDPDLRLTALLHDIGKPQSQWIDPTTGIGHYYKHPEHGGEDHDKVGAAMAETRLRALKYPKSRIQRIHGLITHHMFPAFSSPKGARKFLNRVGDHADDLMILRHADMYGKGTDEYQDTKTPVDDMKAHVETVRNTAAPTTQASLALDGRQLMDALGLQPGPQIGQIKQYLMDQVLENPELNTPEALIGLAQGTLQ